MSEPTPEIDVPPPPAADPMNGHPTDDIDKTTPTAGERLVGLSKGSDASFPTSLAMVRGARTIDVLLSLPLHIIEINPGTMGYDGHHRMIIEEAVKRQIEATMWAVKALTWGRS